MIPAILLFLEKQAEICFRPHTHVSQPAGALSHSILRYRPVFEFGENNPFLKQNSLQFRFLGNREPNRGVRKTLLMLFSRLEFRNELVDPRARSRRSLISLEQRSRISSTPSSNALNLAKLETVPTADSTRTITYVVDDGGNSISP
jgi:hypothetical protein